MKELSIEEKAKTYDEAIEKGKQIQNTPYTAHWDIMKEVAEHLFPELAESEDEKMRRWIINYLDNKALNSGIIQEKTNIKNAIAWLEKQGEQKPNPCDGCTNRKGCINCENGELRETEHKPADKSKIKPKFKTGDRVVGVVSGMPYFITEVCDDHYNTESGCIIMFCSQDNFDLYEQKPAWSEEDYNKINYLIATLQNSTMHNPDLRTVNEEIENWLKSLRPQNRWKPSDKQMKLLREVQQALLGKDCHNRFVNFMYELKRLREE